MSTEIEFDDDGNPLVNGGAPLLTESDLDAGATPAWVKEGTQDDDVELTMPNISNAKAMGPQSEWIPTAKGIRVTVEKAVLEDRGPKDGDWKSKMLNLYLKVADGIVYPPGGKGDGRNAKPGDKPDTIHFRNKMFFDRVGCAINTEGTDEKGRAYDFTVNAAGKASNYYAADGGFWGEFKEVLEALGFKTDGSVKNNKAFRDSLVGRSYVLDIEKVVKKDYDSKTQKRTTVKGEYENKLFSRRKVTTAAAPKAATLPAAPAAPELGDAPPWTEEA